jgi:hypothetical protein
VAKDLQVEARTPQHRHVEVFSLPFNHKPGLPVPKGGSSCSNCEYLGKDGESCTNRHFIKWNGGNRLPMPADEYCSDWWEDSKEKK